MTSHQTACGLSRSGFLPDRTVHLHPLDRCNLACSHCYSTSSPQRQTMLPLDAILAALPHLRCEGYEVVSLSGGEPLLYPDLPALVKAAKALGFRVVAISNGYRVTKAHARLIEGLDGIGISFDGMEQTHLAMRHHPRAWVAAIGALQHLRDIGKPAAAAFTVTCRSMAEVPEFVELCASLGVRAVQLRPVVMAGRAVAEAGDLALPPGDLARLWLMGQTLALAYQDEMAVHVDLAPAEALQADRGAWDIAVTGKGERLSDVVNPLVITPDGRLRPFTYDFPDAFDLGRLADLCPERRGGLMARLPDLGRLVGTALDRVGQEGGFIDWFAYQRDQARIDA